ncbi:MAG: hypothetical protein HY342_02830 [Candidatus Lambdaproteobacteria bacterium]|nr:hypothetical protein [Candidatus Lambdaproteobacteria bacterium]
MNTTIRRGVIAIALLLLAACSREPANLEARFRAAVTAPGVIADWIIQGRNDFMLVDLRAKADFEAAHIPGAISLPASEMARPEVTRSLPEYKKLVFYAAGNDVDPELLYPAFARGLHVMIMDRGYAGWQRNVLAEPPSDGSPRSARLLAVSKYFRGESALGTAKPLEGIPARQYIRPPSLPIQPAAGTQSEGC